ncbi:MAG: hypothetical protein AB7G28_24425 [Pirellulales bacterium]
MSRFHPRVSLLTALLLTTIVGLAIALAKLALEHRALREQAWILRRYDLHVENASRFHVRRDSLSESHWRWRVWIPEDKDAALHFQWGNVPNAEFPTDSFVADLPTGDVWLGLCVLADTESKPGIGMLYYTRPGTWDKPVFLKEFPIRAAERWFYGGKSTVKQEVFSHRWSVDPENEKQILLQRVRVGENGDPAMEPSDGYVLWLESK